MSAHYKLTAAAAGPVPSRLYLHQGHQCIVGSILMFIRKGAPSNRGAQAHVGGGTPARAAHHALWSQSAPPPCLQDTAGQPHRER